MKKNTIKAFTLVEMLIVIVIIGILIASLMPRMQTAQWRARDVARKNDLSQIQTAIITSQQDRGVWPQLSWAKDWMAITWDIEEELKTAWMTAIPKDPNGSNIVSWLWTSTGTAWCYMYLVTYRNGVKDAWFALMAKTEVEWWSNWVTCDSVSGLSGWHIDKGEDLKNITTCTSLDKADSASECGINNGACKYYETSELRYLLVY